MSSNWQNDLTSGIQKFERMIEDAKAKIGNNPEVRRSYQEVLEAIANARENISRFVATFNKEYR